MKNIAILLIIFAGAISLYITNQKNAQPIEDYNTAVEYLKNDEYAKAIPYLEKAMAAKPNEARILTAIEEAYSQTGQSSKAESISKKIKNLTP